MDKTLEVKLIDIERENNNATSNFQNQNEQSNKKHTNRI